MNIFIFIQLGLISGLINPTLSSEDPTCGETALTATTEVSLPWQPPKAQLTSSTTCAYLITAEGGDQILLNFTAFTTPGDGSECTTTYVKIEEEEDEKPRNTIGTFCGSNIPPPVLGKGKKLHVTIKTDGTITPKAITATYKTVPKTFDLMCGETALVAKTTESDGWNPPMADMTGDKTCAYVITADGGNKIQLTFSAFTIPKVGETCDTEYVKIEEEVEGTGKNTVGTYCGSDIPPPILGNGNKLHVTIKSNTKVSKNAITAKYKSVTSSADDVCGETSLVAKTTESDEWKPPNADMTGDKTCAYVITADGGNKIQLTFSAFNIPGDGKTCDSTFVKIEEEVEGTGKKAIGTYCGTSIPPPILGNGKKLHVTIHTDSKVPKNAFTASFKSSGVVMVSPSQLIISLFGLSCVSILSLLV